MTWDGSEPESWERDALDQLQRHYLRPPSPSVIESHLDQLRRVSAASGPAPRGSGGPQLDYAARAMILAAAAAVIVVGAYVLAARLGGRAESGPAGLESEASIIETSASTTVPGTDGQVGQPRPEEDAPAQGDPAGPSTDSVPVTSLQQGSTSSASPSTSATGPGSTASTTVPTTASTTGPGSTASTTVPTTVLSGATCDGLPATIVGTAGPDVLVGTTGDDVIVGGNGNDLITGLGGDDVICGGNGVDELFGGDGDDRLYGGNGPDSLHGGNGSDLLRGGEGQDELDGTPGEDTLIQD